MTTIYETKRKLRRASKQSYKSLLLSIPPEIRDIMEFEHQTELTIKVCLNKENKKYLRIQKTE